MRVLSLMQPYATAIVQGPKRIENRPRVIFYPKDGSEWVGIHASLRWYGDQLPGVSRAEWLTRLLELWPSLENLLLQPAKMPRGAIIGVARFTGVHTYDASDPGLRGYCEAAHGPWAFGPVCYTIDRAAPVGEPFPCRGHLGLWDAPVEALPRLSMAVADALAVPV